jgi:hypothetical protein
VEAEPTEDERAVAAGGLGGGNTADCCCWIVARMKRERGVNWPSISGAGFWFSHLLDPLTGRSRGKIASRLYRLGSKLVTAMAPLNFSTAMSYASAASTSVAAKSVFIFSHRNLLIGVSPQYHCKWKKSPSLTG